MKRIAFLLVATVALVSCQKSKVEKSVCSSPALYMEMDSVSYVAMPTLITPNGDGVNDELVVIAPGNIAKVTVSILNSKGEAVGAIQGAGQTWDGTSTAGKDAGKIVDGEYECTVIVSTTTGVEDTKIFMVSVLANPGDYCPDNKDGCTTEVQWSDQYRIFNRQVDSGETFSCE